MHRDKSTEATPSTEELPFLDEILAEGERLSPSWRKGLFDLRLSGVPMNAEDDEEDEDRTLTKREADKLRKAIAKKDREVRDKQQELDRQGERITALEEKLEAATEGGGNDEGGNKALEARIEKAEQRAEKAEAKADAAEEKRVEAEQTATAVDVATRLNFRNPKRAIKQLDSDDLTDEDSIESALEQLATEEPYMVSSKKQRTVDDDSKPRSKKAAKKSADRDEDDEKKTGEDEPRGKALIKQAYDEATEESDEGGDEGGSDD
jgi:hypothetical protein